MKKGGLWFQASEVLACSQLAPLLTGLWQEGRLVVEEPGKEKPITS